MKKIIFSLSTLLILSACGPKQNDSRDIAEDVNEERFDDTNLENDIDFVMDAAEGGMLEVKLAELALVKGTSSEVKQFAQTMINDHGKANSELKSMANTKNIVLPDSLSGKKLKDFEDFTAKKAEDFDKAYCEYMVKDHKEDIDEFKKEADKGKDPEIKNWAAGKVATLESHLLMAKTMEDAVKNKK